MADLPDWWPFDKQYEITDCLSAMMLLPDKSVDLIATDPPYGVGLDYGPYDDTQENLIGMIRPFIRECKRIAKVTLITPGYNNIYIYPKPDHVLCWYYAPGQTHCSWGFNSWQPILAYGKDPYLANRLGGRDDSIAHPQGAKDDIIEGHPCPKPLKMWKRLIERGSVRKGDVVLDPFLGSGTTLRACRELDRVGLGFEINPDFEPIIKKRMMEDIPTLEGYFGNTV